jgi:hypothetical protein
MMKRLTWFVGGVAAGASGVGYAKRKVKAKAAQVSPLGVARGAAQRARRTVGTVADAVREGRHAMTQHEDELKARRDGRLTTLDQHVQPGDRVFVDGVAVESDRVIVMRPK